MKTPATAANRNEPANRVGGPIITKPARATATACDGLDRYLRAVNYLAAAQVYLQANPLLDKPLRPEHIRERLLGHWGTGALVRASTSSTRT